MRTKLFTALAVIGLLVAGLAGYGGWKLFQTGQRLSTLNREFATLTVGMSEAEVRARMGEPLRTTKDIVPFWGDEPLPEARQREIRRTLVYHVPTFFLGIYFEVSLDAQGAVVAKHRFD